MANYYVIKYTNTRQSIAEKPLTDGYTAEQKQKELEFWTAEISKYQQVVDLLAPHTVDQVMPKSIL